MAAWAGLGVGCSGSGSADGTGGEAATSIGAGTCAAGCDDGNPCTVDRCEGVVCASEAVADGTACGDDDACNGDETCVAGACETGTPPALSDGDDCTLDVCVSPGGAIVHERTGDCLEWTPIAGAGAPSARRRHTAVWSGSRMLVWGGVDASGDSVGTGAAYDPTTDTWSPISTTGAPGPRQEHRAVWTGSKMLVWGGFGTTDFEQTGGAYDPVSDTWQTMSTVGAPSPRARHGMAWDGSRLVVFGGYASDVAQGGAAYDPATDAWSPLPAGGPSNRFNAGVAGVDDRVVVFGGTDLFDWLSDGATLRGDSWTSLPPGGPGLRESMTAIGAGSEAMFWGGWDGGNFLGDGGRLRFSEGSSPSWIPIPADATSPSGRAEHASAWTGAQLFVWGGCGGDACSALRDDGGLYDATGKAWSSVAASATLSARRGALAVYTGRELLVWGGFATPQQLFGDGARAVLRVDP